jgi:glycosyltransferase involved in cell wall biosynthesis
MYGKIHLKRYKQVIGARRVKVVKMKIKIQQLLFGNTLYSWSIVGQSIGRSLIKMGHDVHFVSTDGVKKEYTPADLKPYIRKEPDKLYEVQLSYTMPSNFVNYLNSGNTNRFGIWNYDASVPPTHLIKYCNWCSKFMPSSNFSANNFLKAKVSKDKLAVVPHGINLEEFKTKKKFKLKTKKKYKILLNMATPHLRKNVKNTLKAYGEAFNKDDDVCLVIKVSFPKGFTSSDKNREANNIDFFRMLDNFKKKYKRYGEVEVVRGFIPSLVELYNACDIVFMMSHFECFHIPSLEGLAAGKLVIASNWGGQTHFLNQDNSLQIDGKVVRMPTKYQYWDPSVHSEMIQPSIESAVEQLHNSVNNYDKLLEKFKPNIEATVNKFTWDNVTKQILEYVK